jgi:hypothetical protein
MQTLNYFASHTLVNFEELQKLLKSTQPIGREQYKAKCSMVALNFNHTLEFLVKEKESEICALLGLQIAKGANEPSDKNQILRGFFRSSFNYLGMTISGRMLKVLYDVGDLSKHGRITRKFRQVSDYSQVEECLLLILHNSQGDEYYSIHTGVMVTDDNGKKYNLEKVVNLGIGILSTLLFDLGIIDSEPDIWGQCRSFGLTPEEADKTFEVKQNICELPQYGDRGSPTMLKQVFDPKTRQFIRFPKEGDCFNINVEVPIEVVSTPFLKKPRTPN